MATVATRKTRTAARGHSADGPAPEPAMYFRLDGTTWETYEAILKAVGDRPIYVTYDRGTLELMAPGFDHESPKMRFHDLIFLFASENGFRLVSSGSTTFKKKVEDRGFEPDQSYFVGSADKLPGGKLDVKKGPPPDLAVEVDVYSVSLDRLPLYATWGVGEVWRYDGETIEILGLKKSSYKPLKASGVFPGVTAALLVEAFGLYEGDEVGWIESVRRLVRERLNPGRQT